MWTDTCRWIQVARPGYMLTVSRRHNCYPFMSRSTCIPLYPATDGRQTGDSFVADTRHILTATSGYKWTCIRQHVSWCKRSITVHNPNPGPRPHESLPRTCYTCYTCYTSHLLHRTGRISILVLGIKIPTLWEMLAAGWCGTWSDRWINRMGQNKNILCLSPTI